MAVDAAAKPAAPSPPTRVQVGDTILGALRAGGTDCIVSVPDFNFVDLLAQIDADPSFKHIPVSREEEGIGVCVGAYLGGLQPVRRPRFECEDDEDRGDGGREPKVLRRNPWGRISQREQESDDERGRGGQQIPEVGPAVRRPPEAVEDEDRREPEKEEGPIARGQAAVGESGQPPERDERRELRQDPGAVAAKPRPEI